MNYVNPIDLETLLRTPTVDSEHGFDISPDCETVAFSWNKSGQWEIYLLKLHEIIPPKQITNGPGGKFAPKYSPDGSVLLYLLDLDGGESFDIYRCDLQTGLHRNLTPNTPESIQPGVSWSPDGAQIAFQSDRNNIYDTYILPADGGQARLAFQCGEPNEGVFWSPGGTHLAVITLSHGQDLAAYLVPLNGEPAQIISDGAQNLNIQHVCWSPDGKQIAFSVKLADSNKIGIYTLANKEIFWFSAHNNEVESLDWSQDGEHIAYILSKGADTWLAVQEIGRDRPHLVQVASGVHYTPVFTPDSQHLIFIFDNFEHPSDLWELTLSGGGLRQLTQSLPPELLEANFIRPEHIWYPGLDDVNVPALLFKPNNSSDQLPPGIIVMHGGPTWLFQQLWYPIFQHMASRGWVVLCPNYRGSTGYGQTWQTANRFDLGGGDTRDIVAGAEYLISTGLVNPKMIAVTGRSYGGYLTMTCLTQYPEYFIGGSAIVPFLNWFASHDRIREDLQHWDIENMGDPVENYQRWFDASPYFYLDRIQNPVQLICGANDPRCPANDSIEARDRLLSLGKIVDFILYQDEGHIFLKIENVVDHELRRIAFLAALFKSTPVL